MVVFERTKTITNILSCILYEQCKKTHDFSLHPLTFAVFLKRTMERYAGK